MPHAGIHSLLIHSYEDLLMTSPQIGPPHGARRAHSTSRQPVAYRLTLALLAAMAGLFAWLPLPSSAAVVLFDNLSAGSPNGNMGVSNTQWPAQAFSTTATDFVLDEVELQLWNNTGTTGTFELQVWDALGASGTPGSQVGGAIYTGLAQNLSGSSSGLLTASSLNVTLAASTNYYLVARGTSLTDVGTPPFTFSGGLAWNQTNVNTTATYVTPNSAGSWTGPMATDSFMRVTAVPEPATGMLVVAALVAWWPRRCVQRARRSLQRQIPRTREP